MLDLLLEGILDQCRDEGETISHADSDNVYATLAKYARTSSNADKVMDLLTEIEEAQYARTISAKDAWRRAVEAVDQL